MQDCNNIALAMELLQSCTKPSIWTQKQYFCLLIEEFTKIISQSVCYWLPVQMIMSIPQQSNVNVNAQLCNLS